jgi:hypothetical protein
LFVHEALVYVHHNVPLVQVRTSDLHAQAGLAGQVTDAVLYAVHVALCAIVQHGVHVQLHVAAVAIEHAALFVPFVQVHVCGVPQLPALYHDGLPVVQVFGVDA